MYFAVIDCGTTNSRIYILDREKRVVSKIFENFGVRDVAVHGSKEILKENLHKAFLRVAREGKVNGRKIKFAVASGVITSEIGLVELSHLKAPVTIDELAEGVRKIKDKSVFPLDIPVFFIRGVKTLLLPQRKDLKSAGKSDFMRGEETQTVGFLSAYKAELPVILVFLTSHTKYVAVDEKRKIKGSITTLSGQVYEAVVSKTVIGKSVKGKEEFEDSTYFDSSVIDYALSCVEKSGLLRTLLLTRIADVLLETDLRERKFFLEAAIAAEDIKALGQFEEFGFPQKAEFVIIGENKRRSKIYEYLFKKMKPDLFLKKIDDRESIERLTVNGSIEIIKRYFFRNPQEKELAGFSFD
ncbi:2-dehydro-3-deoxygalactonokinase [Candidatus Aerophobetes bacterium]|nr:2-dehydro-3-deoxygalactonokinase [Candidatus Aerophobetes bacterium]